MINLPLHTSGDKDLTKFVFKKLDFYMDHDTEAKCLSNVGPLCNKKSAIWGHEDCTMWYDNNMNALWNMGALCKMVVCCVESQ